MDSSNPDRSDSDVSEGLANRAHAVGVMSKVERPAFVLAVAILGLGLILALGVAPRHPFVDLPQHVAAVSVWHRLSQDPELASFYRVDLGSPYLLAYLLLRAFLVMGCDVLQATRWTLTFSALLIPFGYFLLLKSRGRSLQPVLLSFPLATGHALVFGFLPFHIGIGVSLVALAAFCTWIRRPGLPWGLAAAAMGCLMWTTHPVAALIWGLSCIGIVLVDPGPARDRVMRILPTTPLFLCMGAWLWQQLAKPRAGSVAIFDYGLPLLGRLLRFARFSAGGLTEPHTRSGTWVIVLAGVLVSSAALGGVFRAASVRRGRSARAPCAPAQRMDCGFTGLALLFGALYLLVPFGVADSIFYLPHRLAPYCVLYALGSIPWPKWASLRLGLVLLSTWMVMSAQNRFGEGLSEFRRDSDCVDALMASLPPGSTASAVSGGATIVAPFLNPVLDHALLWGLAEHDLRMPVWAGSHFLLDYTPRGEAVLGGARLSADSAGEPAFEFDRRPPEFVALVPTSVLPTRLPILGSAASFTRVAGCEGWQLFRRSDAPTTP